MGTVEAVAGGGAVVNVAYLVQQRRELAVFTRLLASYGCAGDGDKPCGECGPCEASRWLKDHAQTLARPRRGLTPREREVFDCFPLPSRSALQGKPARKEWLRPMDVGGHDASDHSAVLQRLVIKGYVEMREWGGHVRPSWRYRRVFA